MHGTYNQTNQWFNATLQMFGVRALPRGHYENYIICLSCISLVTLFGLQLHVWPTHFSVTATCASTTHWCVMVFRTVCSPGMRIIAKVKV